MSSFLCESAKSKPVESCPFLSFSFPASGWLAVCLSVCLSQYLSMCLSICLMSYQETRWSTWRMSSFLCESAKSKPVDACLFLSFSFPAYGLLAVCLFVYLSVCLCVCLPLSLSLPVCLYFCLLVCLYVYLSVCCLCLPACLSVCLPACLPVCLSVCLSLSLSLSLSTPSSLLTPPFPLRTCMKIANRSKQGSCRCV